MARRGSTQIQRVAAWAEFGKQATQGHERPARRPRGGLEPTMVMGQGRRSVRRIRPSAHRRRTGRALCGFGSTLPASTRWLARHEGGDGQPLPALGFRRIGKRILAMAFQGTVAPVDLGKSTLDAVAKPCVAASFHGCQNNTPTRKPCLPDIHT